MPPSATIAQFALHWIVQFLEVTMIPGAKTPEQIETNGAAGGLSALDEATGRRVVAIYDTYIRSLVHHRW